MIRIHNYLTTKISKSKIKATDKTLRQIVKEQLDKYGHDCDLNHIDVSEVIKMYHIFSCSAYFFGENYKDLNPDISEWDVSNVKYMGSMFYECRKFNCNISNWDVSNVVDMNYMFYKCSSFNQDIGEWDVSNVEDIRHMFDGCTKFNQDLSKWTISAVKYSNNDMFRSCPLRKKYFPTFI